MCRRGVRRTTWEPGKSGNPRGRPTGIKEALPRGLVKRLVLETLQESEAEAKASYRRMLGNARTVGQALDLAAKLNKEIGSGAIEDMKPVVINFHSNVRGPGRKLPGGPGGK
ncbi:MAG: DUF5681 domain-containing protein [Candidatus Rokuibacteriota bacterium]